MKVLLFFDNYPQDQIPRLGSHGEKWREKALMFQMPKQDISQDHCHFLKNEDAVKHYQKFIEERNHNALDIGLCLINSDDPDLVSILNIYTVRPPFCEPLICDFSIL